jgi:hypothetical protein
VCAYAYQTTATPHPLHYNRYHSRGSVLLPLASLAILPPAQSIAAKLIEWALSKVVATYRGVRHYVESRERILTSARLVVIDREPEAVYRALCA